MTSHNVAQHGDGTILYAGTKCPMLNLPTIIGIWLMFS